MMWRALLLLAAGSLARAAYWMEEIAHNGRSPFHPDPAYQVFRNVKDFGAVGDGVHDDTAAINAAISSGDRCEPGVCKGSTISPATVYFPAGTYLISNSIIDLYYTQMIGDPTNRPIIKASAAFPNTSFGLIDSNPYQSNGVLAWNSTNTFFRQIRNFVLDTTALPPEHRAVGIHWPSSQATSITNCLFQLSMVPGNNHTGLFIEEGSGGLLNDLYFYGGGKAAILGNQQYTARNIWFFNADVAINIPWNWGWTYKSVFFTNCRVGIQMDQTQRSTGSITLLDSGFTNVEIAIATTRSNSGNKGTNGTLVMENVKFEGVKWAVVGPDGVVLDNTNIDYGAGKIFVMGHVANNQGLIAQTGYYTLAAARSPKLLDGARYYERSKPQYEQLPGDRFLSARMTGAAGDGVTDDTRALNQLFAYTTQQGLVAYLDAGLYIVTDTIYIPPGARIVGEALASIIMAAGPNFQDPQNPRQVVQVGHPGQVGRIEWSDTIVSTRGACAGAILIEFNLFSGDIPSGMWDLHTRIGGFPGTNLQLAQCPAIPGDHSINVDCIAAFMSMRITAEAGGLLTENGWLWVADHDLEDQQYRRVTVFAGRGLLVESRRGGIWLSATGSEHHVLYQYQLLSTQDIYIGHLQTETPYFQPLPLARYPFPVVPQLQDPDFQVLCQNDRSGDNCEMAWALRIFGSNNIAIYGAGLYSFFDLYSDKCAAKDSGRDCQTRLLSLRGPMEGVEIMGLSTVGTTVMAQQNGVDTVPAWPNNNTFADSLALYEP